MAKRGKDSGGDGGGADDEAGGLDETIRVRISRRAHAAATEGARRLEVTLSTYARLALLEKLRRDGIDV